MNCAGHGTRRPLSFLQLLPLLLAPQSVATQC
jgi:hypothetical protein